MGKKLLILVFVISCTLAGMAHYRNNKPEIVYQAVVMPSVPVKGTGSLITEMSKPQLPPISEVDQTETIIPTAKPQTRSKKSQSVKQNTVTTGYPKISDKTLDMIAPISMQSPVEVCSTGH